MSSRPFGLALLACLVSLAAPLSAQDPAALFHEAYFLEHERGQAEEALALYRRVAATPSAGAELQRQARERAARLAEDLASLDLARLMPPETIFYAELAAPGQALLRVLEQLGLVGSIQDAAAKKGFALSPELVQGLTGIRGLALALTRLPAGGGPPGGVVVLNAGDLAILRGSIEAALLARGAPAEAIEGVPAWTLEGRIHVAVSRRLVVAATEREAITGVLRRMARADEPSLATSGGLKDELAERDGAPFFCGLDAAPVRPLLKALLTQSGRGDTRALLLASALDIDSLQSCVARATVGDDGLVLEADLFLAADHRNLVFNLMRGAPIDPVLLERIPEGAAAFLTGSFNERGPAIAPLERNPDGAPVVTAMDLGRELFANLAGYALFVLPGGAPVPSFALVLSSNDPARTGAVLGLAIGLVQGMTTGSVEESAADEIAGAATSVFRLPPAGMPLYVATQENTLVLSCSEEMIELALEGRSNGNSVLHDEAFAPALGRLSKDTTFALCAQVGRSLAVAQPFLKGKDRDQLALYAPAFADTVVTLLQRHSGTRFGLELALHHLPRLDGLVNAALERQRASGGYPQAAGAVVEVEPLMQGFERRAGRDDGGAAARAFARREVARIAGDPRALNNFAWALLTEERFGQRFDDLAREVAQAADDASGHAVWQYLDTLALAHFRCGEVKEAIAVEERVLAKVGAADRPAVEASLARYRAAAGTLAAETPR